MIGGAGNSKLLFLGLSLLLLSSTLRVSNASLLPIDRCFEEKEDGTRRYLTADNNNNYNNNHDSQQPRSLIVATKRQQQQQRRPLGSIVCSGVRFLYNILLTEPIRFLFDEWVCGYYEDDDDTPSNNNTTTTTTTFVENASRPEVCGYMNLLDEMFTEVLRPGVLVCGSYDQDGMFQQNTGDSDVCGVYNTDGDFVPDIPPGLLVCGFFNDDDIFVPLLLTETDRIEYCGTFDESGDFNVLFEPLVETCGFFDPDTGEFVEDGNALCGYFEYNGTFVEEETFYEETCGYFDTENGGVFVEDFDNPEVCGFIDEDGFFVEEVDTPGDEFTPITCSLYFTAAQDETIFFPEDSSVIGRVFQWAFNAAFLGFAGGDFSIVYVEVLEDREAAEEEGATRRQLQRGSRDYQLQAWWGCNCDGEIPLGDAFARRRQLEALMRYLQDAVRDAITRLLIMAREVFWRLRGSFGGAFLGLEKVQFNCTGGDTYVFDLNEL
eukprot:CAMPEP_0118723074 /NCGR_PEP_ID=MMETSP0800-20121206/31787_1 /TAXON_ID=210618 ORGANISM="Striatella unipunctata, Strain CCMP2910" /NCGR_SAMPLE_ID=MMETSP0800 /ASSEMBLY_ACC=CAM_ASM_000638 /LENGTH=490 /DNA_ID=CAMNT_0006631431 /DNA_START=50 /DNA_END=1522 /DNA_ORIENTATION=+